MHIQQKISETRSFSELLPLSQHAEVKLSFWGGRYVCVDGYKGTLDVDALASKTLELLRQKKYEFSEDERVIGRQLASRIDVLYNDSVVQCVHAPCFTKTLGFFIGVISSFFHRLIGHPNVCSEWYGKGRYANDDSGQYSNEDFMFYTQAQLQNKFNISPTEASRRELFSYEINGIRRWRSPRNTEVRTATQIGPNQWEIPLCQGIENSALRLSGGDLRTLPDSTTAFGINSKTVIRGIPSEKSNIF
jgi:hypothetical protein